jgi:hypothetical protein
MSFPVLWFGPGKTETWVMGFFTLAECFAITISVFYARRFFDKRSFSSLGLSLNSTWLKDIFAGLGIASLMMGSIFIVGYLLDWISVESYSWKLMGYKGDWANLYMASYLRARRLAGRLLSRDITFRIWQMA